MDATSTDADLHYSDCPPILVAASSDHAMARAERSAAAAGLRIGARMPIEIAGERIDQQIATTSLWVELDSDRGRAMDDLAHEPFIALTSETLLRQEIDRMFSDLGVQLNIRGEASAGIATCPTRRTPPPSRAGGRPLRPSRTSASPVSRWTASRSPRVPSCGPAASSRSASQHR